MMSESSKPVFLEIHATISAANAFMKCLYRAGLWLSHGERDFLLKAGSRCVNFFSKCALRAYNANCTRWKFMPKFHLFGEWLFTWEMQKRLGLPSPNILMFSCQMDEDYVGKISAISRTVSLRTVHTRTLSRYLIALVANWEWNIMHNSVDSNLVTLKMVPTAQCCPMTGPLWSDRSCIFGTAAGWIKINMHRLCCTVDGLLNSCGRKMLHLWCALCMSICLSHGVKKLEISVPYFWSQNRTQWRSWHFL